MKKLQAKEQKNIIGGGGDTPCRLDLCAYTLPGFPLGYSGQCPIANNCTGGGYVYIITTITDRPGCIGPASNTYCTI